MPILPLLKGCPNLPSNTSAKVQLEVLKQPIFWTISVPSFFQALAFYIPPMQISGQTHTSTVPAEFLLTPSIAYAIQLGLSRLKSTLLLTMISLTTILGQVMLGHISDRVNVHIPLLASTVTSSLIVFTLWLLGRSFGLLMTFCVLYGLFAGGYGVLYARFTTSLSRDSNTNLWMYGILSFQRGVGYVVAGPLTSALIGAATKENELGGISRYRHLIIFVGVAFGLSSLGGVGWVFTHRKGCDEDVLPQSIEKGRNSDHDSTEASV